MWTMSAKELKASALSIGDMTLSLGYTDDEGKRQTTDLVLKNVSAKKTLPKVKTLKVTIPAAAANDGSAVIGSVNLLSSYKDSAKHTQMIAPAEVTLENKGVEASVDILNQNRIRIKKLDGKSGTIKVTLTYPGGVTKKVTIKVVQGK